jgi:hypothetical protein
MTEKEVKTLGYKLFSTGDEKWVLYGDVTICKYTSNLSAKTLTNKMWEVCWRLAHRSGHEEVVNNLKGALNYKH